MGSDSSSDGPGLRVAVVGTGTEVGKTYVSCALARGLVAAGRVCRGLKPVESGLGPDGVARDARALARAAGHGVVPPLHGFERAVSPHLEARRVGAVIRRREVSAWVDAHAMGVTLVETAGGLLSPLGVGSSNLDLVAWVGAVRLVVVAPDRLGVLHDVAAVRAVLEGAGWWERAAVVLSQGTEADASTGTNAAELVRLGLATEVMVVSRGGSVKGVELATSLGERFT